MNDPLIESAKEIEALRAQVAALGQDKEYAWKNVHILEAERQKQDKQLVAAQARIEELHGLLSRFGAYAPNECQDEINKTLSTPDDSSVLDAALKAERERCAKVCLEMQQGWASDDHIECADTIRSMT